MGSGRQRTGESAGTGAEAPPDSDVESPETYIGYDRADSFLSPGGLKQDVAHAYSFPKHLELNQWGFAGTWTDHAPGCGSRFRAGQDRLPFSRARCASGAGACFQRETDPLSRQN